MDTSGWTAFVYRPDPAHPSNYILTELVALLTRNRFPRPGIITAINKLKSDPNVVILHIDETTDGEAWRRLQGRQDKDWSLVDAASFVVMRRHGITDALTTDHHFDQAGFTRLPSP